MTRADRAPLALIGGRLTCADCGRSGEVAEARVLITHAAACPLGSALAEVERARKPVMVYAAGQAVLVFTAEEGRTA